MKKVLLDYSKEHSHVALLFSGRFRENIYNVQTSEAKRGWEWVSETVMWAPLLQIIYFTKNLNDWKITFGTDTELIKQNYHSQIGQEVALFHELAQYI